MEMKYDVRKDDQKETLVISAISKACQIQTLRDKLIFVKPPILVGKMFENKGLPVEKNGSEDVESVGSHACCRKIETCNGTLCRLLSIPLGALETRLYVTAEASMPAFDESVHFTAQSVEATRLSVCWGRFALQARHRV